MSAPDDIPACPPLPETPAPARPATTTTPAAAGPARLTAAGVLRRDGRRDLAQRAAAAAPGVRFASAALLDRGPRRSRTVPSSAATRRSGCGTGPAPARSSREQANAVLLRLVHPLLARGLPYCLGFSFGSEVLAPRGAAAGETTVLDLEDIGRLLGVILEVAATGS